MTRIINAWETQIEQEKLRRYAIRHDSNRNGGFGKGINQRFI
ncbi:hypothetical protein [Methylomicrobium agile]|nr:hypothetical protein [Methylomicrobium agile]